VRWPVVAQLVHAYTVATGCIDKRSSAELSEAINSMYAWYRNSAACYVYLSDVPGRLDEEARIPAIRRSSWFTRAWTLQELLAPNALIFCDNTWTAIGTLHEPSLAVSNRCDLGPQLAKTVSSITGIAMKYLVETKTWPRTDIRRASIAERMNWAATRHCTRREDAAYSLLGLFDVNMPLLYGEADKAFLRLQEEIIKKSTDMSIFAWRVPMDKRVFAWTGIFAASPVFFTNSRHICSYESKTPFDITNMGLRLEAESAMVDIRQIEPLISMRHKDYKISLLDNLQIHILRFLASDSKEPLLIALVALADGRFRRLSYFDFDVPAERVLLPKVKHEIKTRTFYVYTQ
jgi:hypothetical protein